MNWSQPRKNFKSSEKNMTNQKASTTYLYTPPRQTQTLPQQQNISQSKQCPYHFGQPTHICLTCRRSICLRCAITYCQQHTIYAEEQILPLLLVDLQKLTIQPRIQDIQLRLKQSNQRQQYLLKKIQKMLTQIQQNFQHIKIMLEKKKEQIIQYFKQELSDKFIIQYKKYDDQLAQKLSWLKDILQNSSKCNGIEQLDQLALLIKKQIPNAEAMSKAQIKISKLISGKDKIKTNSLWSQQKLQQILYQIQNIPYRLKDANLNTTFTSSNKKKRIITQISDGHKNQKQEKIEKVITQFNINSSINQNQSNKNPLTGIVNSGSNSRFSTGRKNQF